mmetsp:Transcript_62701/g.147507  ORF Transcript_62701/g.147507 Transcript_62701/m.147507 type:complete len:221 (-) Transcript_62701:163-825(-)
MLRVVREKLQEVSDSDECDHAVLGIDMVAMPDPVPHAVADFLSALARHSSSKGDSRESTRLGDDHLDWARIRDAMIDEKLRDHAALPAACLSLDACHLVPLDCRQDPVPVLTDRERVEVQLHSGCRCVSITTFFQRNRSMAKNLRRHRLCLLFFLLPEPQLAQHARWVRKHSEQSVPENVDLVFRQVVLVLAQQRHGGLGVRVEVSEQPAVEHERRLRQE